MIAHTEPNSENNRYQLDDFNYPVLNRKDLISNRGLDNRDVPMRKFKQWDTNREWSWNNYTLDIEKATPNKYGWYSMKVDYSNTNEDIEKSSPKHLFAKVNKKDYSLNNKDIEHSSPRGHHCFKSNRHVNPLHPEYKLPTANQKYEPYTPKFLRNSMDVSDIKGAKPKKYLMWDTRDNINVFKSENNLAKRIKTRDNPLYNYLDYSDVYAKKPFSNRVTDPLDPKYVFSNWGETFEYSDIDGSKPTTFSKYNTENCSGGLKIGDIEGAKSSTKTFLQRFKIQNNREFNYNPEEIKGAHPGSVRNSITTSRCLNPWAPEYQFWGNSEISKSEYDNNNNNKNKGVYNTIKLPAIDSGITNTDPYINRIKTPTSSEQNLRYHCQENNTDNEYNYIHCANEYSPRQTQDNEERIPDFLKGRIYNHDDVDIDKDKYRKPCPYYGWTHENIVSATEPNQKIRENFFSNQKNPQKYYEIHMKKSIANKASHSKSIVDNNMTGLNPYEHQIDKFIKNQLL